MDEGLKRIIVTKIPKELISALTPARRDFKGIPRKNIKNLCALPLITLKEVIHKIIKLQC